MLVEILCGIIADADYGPNIRKWRNTDRIANLVFTIDLLSCSTQFKTKFHPRGRRGKYKNETKYKFLFENAPLILY